jgi:nucleoid-associated protein YgaU
MQCLDVPPMTSNVTAMALPRSRAATSAGAPASGAAALRRVTGTWSQPEPWTVAVLLVTGIVIIGRHPIARMIGTEVGASETSPTVVSSAPAVPLAAAAGTSAVVQAVPTHAPRDPFRALVGAGSAVLAPAAGVPSTGSTAGRHSTPTVTTPTGAGVTCAGTVHQVVSGDTLWTIAARAVKSTDSQQVTVAWHRIYRANRSTLSDPALLPVGTKLCLPASL